jgi:hypothetical protein
MLLADRRALGEFQPRLRDGTPDGAPIPNYYPPVATEQEWYAARAAAVERRDRKPGRVGRQINPFAGLLHNARDGSSYILLPRLESNKNANPRKKHQVLVAASSRYGPDVPCWSFPYDTFEAAMLSLLAEVDPREVLGQEDTPDETLALSAELTRIEAKIAELEAELIKGDVAAVARVLRQMEARKRQVDDELAEARQRAASPLSESWGECRSLLDALGAAPDPEEARLRLRSVLHRIVESVWILVVPLGFDRLAAVQVYFKGDGRRDYLIMNRRTRSNQKVHIPTRWWARSLAGVVQEGSLDLRKPEHSARLQAALEALDVADLEENR